jgi:hypothetical protein
VSVFMRRPSGSAVAVAIIGAIVLAGIVSLVL